MSAIARLLLRAARGKRLRRPPHRADRQPRTRRRAGRDRTRAENVGDAGHRQLRAIAPTTPSSSRARERGIDIVTRGAMLAQLDRRAQAIAVAGTHGKTTTTAMTARDSRSAGLDPTAWSAALRRHRKQRRNGAGPWFVDRERRVRRFVSGPAPDDRGRHQRRERSRLQRRRTAGAARRVRDIRRRHPPGGWRSSASTTRAARARRDATRARADLRQRADADLRRARRSLRGFGSRFAVIARERSARCACAFPARSTCRTRWARSRSRALRDRCSRRSPRRWTAFAAFGGALRSSARAAA